MVWERIRTCSECGLRVRQGNFVTARRSRKSYFFCLPCWREIEDLESSIGKKIPSSPSGLKSFLNKHHLFPADPREGNLTADPPDGTRLDARAALDTLQKRMSTRQLGYLILRTIYNLNYDEIAKRMGVSSHQAAHLGVQTALYKARRILHEMKVFSYLED